MDITYYLDFVLSGQHAMCEFPALIHKQDQICIFAYYTIVNFLHRSVSMIKFAYSNIILIFTNGTVFVPAVAFSMTVHVANFYFCSNTTVDNVNKANGDLR